MKKLLLALLLVPNCLFAQKLERYCEVMAIGKMFSRKVTITVDFGEEKSFFKDTRVRDDEGNLVKFNTLIDALNYMGTQNWKLVNAFPIETGGQSVYHFYFKKEYDAIDLVPDKK
jgi:hypothetical protein